MSINLAQSFAPIYAAVPAYLKRSAIAISPRFPRDGTVTGVGGQTIGINGSTGTIVPEASAVEAVAWGATVALWSYANLAPGLGFASSSAFVATFLAAGIPIQAATNTSAHNLSTGPFAVDLGGTSWTAGSSGVRPTLVAPPQSPVASRINISVTLMPASDQAGTITPKLGVISAAMAEGCFGLQLDDPRGAAGYSGWRGITSGYDLTSQGVDFSSTAIAGFALWLSVNTTSAERIVLNLPSSVAGFDIVAWLRTNHLAAMQANPNTLQVDTAALDNYLFRTSLSSDSNRRDVILGLHNRYLRDSQIDFTQQLRTTLAGKPLSGNFWQASPCEFVSGFMRKTSGLFDFSIAETAPDYWGDLLPHTIGSDAWYAVRATQCARRHMNAVTYDISGMRAFVEHKPTAMAATTPSGSGFPILLASPASPRMVVQLLRQSIMQSVMEGATPVIPIDVFMTVNDSKSQGVTVDGYRYWGSRADYKSCFDFITGNASLIDGYEKCATVFLAVHSDSFPFQDGAPAARYAVMMARLAELWKRDVDYHWLPVGLSDGSLPQNPLRTVETTAPLVIRLQDDGDYYAHLGRLSGPKCRRWTTSAADEAMGHSPVRSTNPNVRVIARYNSAARRVSLHVQNYAINTDGTPSPQTTTLVWNWARPAGPATVTRLGEPAATADLSGGAASLTLTEYAVVNFAVA